VVSTPAGPGGGLPRILTVMGSGETAPTMVRVHRAVLERLGPPPVPALLLDTPFGFQENATELAQRVVDYFADSLRTRIDVASALPGASGSAAPGPLEPGRDPFANERLVAKLRDARYIFAGPGSPSYALRQWRGTVVPALLTEHLRHGGAVTFSSAAALTLGVATVPVYEIYKVGEEPRWLEGLDVLGVTGLSAAVIPHYNNAEGGTHDTRFCYLGERRLSMLEPELPDGAFVLGIDEHTALVLDLDARTGEVFGNGVVTVRAAGRSRTWAAGEVISFDEIAAAADELRAQSTALPVAPGDTADTPVGAAGSQSAGDGPGGGKSSAGASGRSAAYERSPLLDAARAREEDFAKAIAARDMDGAVQAILELESDITAWSHDIPSGDAMDRARASLRSLIVELGQAGEEGLRDPREVLGPFVETMLQLRQAARAERRFADADAVRDRLTELGVEVRDTATGSEWFLG
jgi:hypothetical protein